MRNGKSGVLLTVLCIGASLPAMAQPRNDNYRQRANGQWDALGSVTIDGRRGPGAGPRPGPDMDRDSRSFNLGGSVERLRFRADGSNIDCRSITARFGNGHTREIYHGQLRQGRDVNVDLPGSARDLNGLTFTCASRDRRDAEIRISADVGRYRNDWVRGPNWQNTWARMFNWGSNTVNDWRLVGTERFDGRRDSEQAFTGWRGVNVDSVALKPLESDAHCSSVRARFGNGKDQALNVNNGNVLRRGMYYKLDLPGQQRNLTSLSLRCSAIGARQVSMQIFTGG